MKVAGGSRREATRRRRRLSLPRGLHGCSNPSGAPHLLVGLRCGRSAEARARSCKVTPDALNPAGQGPWALLRRRSSAGHAVRVQNWGRRGCMGQAEVATAACWPVECTMNISATGLHKGAQATETRDLRPVWQDWGECSSQFPAPAHRKLAAAAWRQCSRVLVRLVLTSSPSYRLEVCRLST